MSELLVRPCFIYWTNNFLQVRMSYLGVEEDEQSSIKVIQRQFEYLNTTLEVMNERLARNETSDNHRRQPHRRVQTPLEDEDEPWYTEYEENQHNRRRGGHRQEQGFPNRHDNNFSSIKMVIPSF